MYHNFSEDISSEPTNQLNEANNEENSKPNNLDSLSKRAKKKFMKRQQWLDSKQERRKKEKEKRKRKMEEKKQNGDTFDTTRTVSRKKLKECKMADSKCKVGVVFDFQFGDLMNQRDLGKSLKQVMKCYSINRRLENPLQMHLASFQGRVADEMRKHQGYENWDLHIHPAGITEVFPLESLVYLSSDSPSVLLELSPSKVYIVGGLVDHNQHKGICQDKAKELNIETARLPIDEFINLKTRKVLTINHVYEIMAEVTQGKTWKEAFLKIIPERKGVDVKNKEKSNESIEISTSKSEEVPNEGQIPIDGDIKSCDIDSVT